MRTDLSAAFLAAEAQAFQQPTIQVVARQNAEGPNWTLRYTNTGRVGINDTGQGAAYGWQGHDHPVIGSPRGSVCVTPGGRLFRTFGVSPATDGLGRIYISSADDSDPQNSLQSLLSDWQFMRYTVSGLGYTSARAAVTRETISADASRVRVFYIRDSDRKLVYVNLGLDGNPISTGGEGVVDNGATWQVACLASPTPSIVFVCDRRNSVVNVPGEVGKQWLRLTAYQFIGSAWVKTAYVQQSTRVAQSALPSWDGVFQFDAEVVDAATGTYVVTILDDLSGRPASVMYQNRHWSDFNTVEAIDFASPEQDEVIGYRLGRWGDKVVMYARQTVSDSDWYNLRRGVLYYTRNGRHWSDPYYICESGTEAPTNEGAPYNWGTPVLWRDELWLVGLDSLWAAPQTSLFGGNPDTTIEVDITEQVNSVSVDEPEGRLDQVQVTVDLDNPGRMYSAHPFVQNGGDIEVRAGYVGTENIQVFRGVILNAQPSDNGQATVNVSGGDYRALLAQGESDRDVVFPQPTRRDITFTTDADLKTVATVQGKWAWESAGSEQYVRPVRQTGLHQLGFSTGLPGRLTWSVRVRAVNPHIGFSTPLNDDNDGGMAISFIWAANDDWREYYAVKTGYGYTDLELWKRWIRREYDAATKQMVDREYEVKIGQSATPAGHHYQFFQNAADWATITITQIQQRIVVALNNDDVIIVDDDSPLVTSGRISVAITMPPETAENGYTGALLSDATIRIDNIRVWSHDYETSAEEFLNGLMVQRGLNGVEVEPLIDSTWAADLDGWTVMGTDASDGTTAASHWVTTGPNLVFNDTFSRPDFQATSVWGLRSDVYQQDGIIDIDMALDTSARFGMLCRASSNGLRFATLSVETGENDLYTNLWPNIQLAVRNGSTFRLYQMASLVPIFIEQRTTFRFVATGPWYAVYVNGLIAATFFDTTIMNIPGYWGLSPGYGSAAGTTTIYRARVPWFALYVLPEVMVGDVLSKYLAEVVDAYQGWMMMDGRTARIFRMSTSTTAVATVTNTRWLGSGYNADYTTLPTAIRVLSKNAEGGQIWGTVYSPTLARARGRVALKTVEVEGLQTEAECREKAWATLVEMERALRTRSYPVHPSLQWERFDLLRAINVEDDTDSNVYLMGSQRTWTRNRRTGGVAATMLARLEEQNASKLTRSALYPPVD